MDIQQQQAATANGQITGEDLAILSLEELEELFSHISASLETTFDTMSSYAREATQGETARPGATRLEGDLQRRWEMLKAIVDAILYHAVFAGEE
jgi:hypothetical protein